MAYIVGIDRNQARMVTTSLDALIDEDNSVRVIDAYVDSFADTFSSFEVSVTSDCTAWAALAVLSCANVGIARENDNANDNTTA